MTGVEVGAICAVMGILCGNSNTWKQANEKFFFRIFVII